MKQKNATPSSAPRIPRSLAIVGALLVLLGLATMVAPFFIPWGKVKDEAVAAGSKALGRELAIDKIEVSLFTGVHIRNLRLANAKGGFSDQALFTNADAKVDVNLLSLFTGKLVINSITFVKPQVLIETNARGISNLQGLGGPSEAPGPGDASAGLATATVGGRTFPAVLLALVIQDGDVVVRDRQKGTETAIHGLNIKLQGLSLAAAGDSRLEADMAAEIQGKQIPLSLTCDFKLDPVREMVAIDSFELKAPALDATMTGSVQDFQKPVVDLRIGADLDLNHLAELLPPSALAELPPNLTTGGGLHLDLSAQGAAADPEDLSVKGGLSFKDVSAAYGSYPALAGMDGTMHFDRSGVDLPDLSFQMGGDPATLAFSAQWGNLGNILEPRSALKADISYTLRSPKLDLDPILGVAAGNGTTGGAPAGPASGPGGLPNYAKSVPRGLSVEGAIYADSVVADGFTTGKLVQRLSLKKQRLSSATDLALYQGRAYERSVVDLSQAGPVFRSSLGVSGLAFRGLMDDLAATAAAGSALSQLKGKVDGTLGITATLEGRGLSEPYLLDNTHGAVNFLFADAVVRKTNVQERLASAIPYPKVQEFLRSDVKFSMAEGAVLYADHRATLKRFSLGSGRDWRQGSLFVQASGDMVLGGALDFKIVPHFNPSLDLIGGDMGRAFQDERGWPTFDYIEYSGPTTKAATADFSAALSKAAGKALSQHMGQIEQAAQQAIQQKLGGLQLPAGLNKLFGQ
jgi:uncharacterized protein involved in outer membrane biogenesis